MILEINLILIVI